MGFILFLLTVFFVVLGLSQFLEILSLWVQQPKRMPPCALVITAKVEIENIEQVLGFCKAKAWETKGCRHVIVVDKGLSKNSQHICQILCESHPCFIVARAEELPQLLDELAEK